MNICGNGVCYCQGGSDVIGEDSSCADSRRDVIGEALANVKEQRYYLDLFHGVVLSVEPHEMKPWYTYYLDPDLTTPV